MEEPASAGQTTRSGRHAPRSKKGCSTCRTRKVKCDETRNGSPASCRRCLKAQVRCRWDEPVQRRKSTARTPGPSLTKDIRPALQNDLPHKDSSRPSAILPALTADSWTIVKTRSSENVSTSPTLLSSPANVLSIATTLDQQDLESFDYVPRSLMVLRWGKPWRWSSLSYIHVRIAPREPGVLRAFIAVASLELRALELHKIQDPSVSRKTIAHAQKIKENASHLLHLAMKDLSQILDRLAQIPNNQDDLEALFSMWLLILHFGIYDSDLVQASYLHLNGVRSFIAEYFHGSSGRLITCLPPLAKQMLVFICYFDVMLALGALGGGQLSLDLMEAPLDSPVNFDRLFEESRVCVPQLWHNEYPVGELLDDLENYRPLKFVHGCQKFKLRVWKFGKSNIQKGFTDPVESENLWSDLEQLGESFHDICLLARLSHGTNGRRLLWTVYHACLDFYALKLFYSCSVIDNDRPPWLEQTITELLRIAHKAIDEDPQQIYRYAWPLRIALVKVHDPIHKEWLQKQVTKASVLLSNLGIPATLCNDDDPHRALFSGHGL